ncbi:tripartite tricarboxylate transporter substrate binding protein [Bordetella tumulicola]|uniref:tripartite tricarboxylate transporter substrate binding protein n=1 Tax=Bordetella tumulicola TaxID=1649133 RepID=UPI0039EFD346
MNRRQSLAVIAALAGAWAAPCAFAQGYPSKPIRLISPYGPGGGNDTIARLLATGLGKTLKQTVIVENKPGANTIIGNQFVATSPPDGYTLILNGNGFATNPSFYAKMPYDTVKDFAPIAFVAFTELVLVANPSVQAKNVPELVALAKSKDGLKFGNTGQGGPEHLASVMFGQMAGAEVTAIPYKGAAPAITDLIGGQIQVMITARAAVQPYIRSGKLKLIAIANNARSSQYPDVPTIAESGMPGFDTSLWYGMMAPAGTPQSIVLQLNQAINKVLREKQVLDTFASRGLFLGDEAKVGTPELFGAFIKSEIANTARIAREAGIEPA